ncbi:MAG: LysM peptidoglycan-binding domain-containing protein [Actinomycetota bacterium]
MRTLTDGTRLGALLIVAASVVQAAHLLVWRRHSLVWRRGDPVLSRSRRSALPRPVRRALSLLGFAVAAAIAPAHGAERPGSSAHRRSFVTPEQAWSRTSGSPPPPPPLVRAGLSEPHPALHGRRVSGEPIGTRLFPRAGDPRARDPRARDKRRAQRLHPSRGLLLYSSDVKRGHEQRKGRSERDGRGRKGHSEREGHKREERSGPSCGSGSYIVRSGDSLWSVAGDELDTNDASRIARYWPQIYARNRSTIGDDPNLIYRGQALELPRDCDT